MTRRRRRVLAAALPLAVCAALGTAIVVIPGSATAATALCHGGTPSDFNGDGISDAAIGEPNNLRAVSTDIGRVHIIYGTRGGLTANASGTAHDDQLLSGAEGFGTSLATVDFNHDGCTDLAVGDPLAENSEGRVDVYLGDPVGLLLNHPQLITRATRVSGDQFGTSLATADVNRDDVIDLIVGAPGANGSGAVAVFFDPNQVTNLNQREFNGTTAFDNFGSSVASGDFNGDGFADIAIGAPGFNNSAGGVLVLDGANLISNVGAHGRFWTQGPGTGISGTAETGDEFGYSVAAGDFNGDHRADLAVGVPLESLGSAHNAGMVNVIYGSFPGGLTLAGNQGWTQNISGVAGTAETGDLFGLSLAAGDFNGNGKTDLAIGVPGEGIGSTSGAGTVNVLAGGVGGLTAVGSSAWSQATSGIAGTAETGDGFGRSLTALRVHSATRDDLLVGAPLESLGSTTQAGMIHLIPGSSSGLTATGSQAFNDDTSGIQGTSCALCTFGASVG